MSRRIAWGFMVCAGSLPAARAAEIVVDFERAVIGKPLPLWIDQGVEFRLAAPLTKSKAEGRITFFPHLATHHVGLVNAMATEQSDPVLARLPASASAVSVTFWGSTGCPALLEALDANGNVIDRAALDAVPSRKAPGDPIPFVTLTVKAPGIAAIRFSGPRDGEFLAADELRITLD